MKKLLVAVVFVIGCTGDDGGSNNNNDPVCGDGAVEGNEQCDDGNIANGDGCTSACTIEPRCGDSVVLAGTEECDDGNTVGGDGCSATCELECGNGVEESSEECDDGNSTSYDGCSATCKIEPPYQITATWQIRDYAGSVLMCPTGYDTAAVIAQPVDSMGNNVGAPIVDLFTCSTGTGTTADLFGGTYKVHIAITNTNGTLTYAQSTTAKIVLDADKSLTAAIYTDAGYFGWAWTLIGATSNSSLTCTQAGAGGVEMISTLTNTTTALSDIFNCEDGSGVTAALPVGSYTVSVSALDASNQALGTAPALTNKQIMGPNKVTDLGTVMIPIDGM